MASSRVCFRLFCCCSKILFLPSEVWPQPSAQGVMFFRRGKEVLWDFTKLGNLYIFVRLPTPYNRLQRRNFFGYGSASMCQVFELWSDVSPHPGSNAAMCIWCFTCNCGFRVSAGLILEQQHADDAILLYAFGLRLISAYSKSLALCSFAPCRSFVRCPVVMSLRLYPCAFFLLSYAPPNFIWLDPRPLSVTNAFCICRLSKYCCLVWG